MTSQWCYRGMKSNAQGVSSKRSPNYTELAPGNVMRKNRKSIQQSHGTQGHGTGTGIADSAGSIDKSVFLLSRSGEQGKDSLHTPGSPKHSTQRILSQQASYILSD